MSIVPPSAAPTHEDVGRRHVQAWAAELLGQRRTLALTGETGEEALRDALAAQEGWEALSWLDAPAQGLPLEGLRAAAGTGMPIVLAARGLGRPEAERLATGLGGFVAGAQLLVQGSLIVDADGRSPNAAAVEDAAHDEAAPDRMLIAVNVGREEAARAAGAVAQLTLDSVYRTQLERLEAAYWALRRANSRLTRENLGRHDAAAAAVVWRWESELKATQETLKATREQLAIEIEVGRRNDEYFQAARARLDEPHHRAAERINRALGMVPGARAVSRRMLSRGS